MIAVLGRIGPAMVCFEVPERRGLGLNNHLSNTIEVLAGDCKGIVDLVEGPLMREDRLEPVGMRPE